MCAVLAAPPQVTVTTSSGGELQGDWKGVVGTELILLQPQGVQKISLTDILSVRSSQRASLRRDGSSRLALVDGSQLLVTEVISAGEKGMVEVVPLGSKERIAIPLKAFRWIRFGASIGEIATQWERLIESETPSDLLIIRRQSGALDQAAGIVLEIEKDRVTFDLDGQSIPAPREKLEGLIFKSLANQNTKSSYEIADSYGSIYRVAKLRGIGDDSIEFETPGGLTRKIPLSSIERLSAEGNVVFLASQEPASMSFSPEFKVPVKKPLFDAWLGPGKVNERTVRLVAPCRLEFRVPDGFQRFQAVIEPDPEVVAGGGCEWILSADGEELQRQTITIDAAPAR